MSECINFRPKKDEHEQHEHPPVDNFDVQNQSPSTNHETIELTLEQQHILSQKREKLLNGELFAFRFVNSKEYFDMLELGYAQGGLETNTRSMSALQEGGGRRSLTAN